MSNEGLELGLTRSLKPFLTCLTEALPTALNISPRTMKTLQIAQQFFPVPGIATAAGVALSIFHEAEVRIVINLIWSNLLTHSNFLTLKASHKRGFITIGKDSCVIVETVIYSAQAYPDGGMPNGSGILQQIDLLVVYVVPWVLFQ